MQPVNNVPIFSVALGCGFPKGCLRGGKEAVIEECLWAVSVGAEAAHVLFIGCLSPEIRLGPYCFEGGMNGPGSQDVMREDDVWLDMLGFCSVVFSVSACFLCTTCRKVFNDYPLPLNQSVCASTFK